MYKSSNINQTKNENANIFEQKEKNNIINIMNIDKKQYNNDDYDNNKEEYLLVPLTNYTKENNCFFNVLIQALFNLEEFREKYKFIKFT